MKRFIATLSMLLSILAGNSAMANYSGPLLEKTYITGHVPEGKSYFLQCTVYSEHVKLAFEKRGYSAQIKKEITLPEDTLDLIDRAHKGILTTTPAPADVGFSIYRAYFVELNDSASLVDLGSIIDSDVATSNSAPEAQTLKELIDSICLPLVPKFHQ